MEENQLQQL